MPPVSNEVCARAAGGDEGADSSLRVLCEVRRGLVRSRSLSCRVRARKLIFFPSSVFVPRGQSAGDRQFRRKRPRSEEQWYAPLPHPPAALAAAVASAAVKPSPSVASPNGSLNAQLLPPHDELVEGVKAFLSSYFQLVRFPLSFPPSRRFLTLSPNLQGFIHETRFLEQLEQGSVPTFLLLAILATSARFSPSLIKRFGGRRAAAEVFKSRALSLVPDEMLLPSLPRLQAFFLLGVSEWAEGSGQRAWVRSPFLRSLPTFPHSLRSH